MGKVIQFPVRHTDHKPPPKPATALPPPAWNIHAPWLAMLAAYAQAWCHLGRSSPSRPDADVAARETSRQRS